MSANKGALLAHADAVAHAGKKPLQQQVVFEQTTPTAPAQLAKRALVDGGVVGGGHGRLV